VSGKRLAGTALLAGLCLLVAACGGKRAATQPPLSARAKESALAKSRLPGATGIGSALRVSDSAEARRRREDSVANSVP
jgi:hypothetical protein